MRSNVALVADDPIASGQVAHILSRVGCTVTTFAHCIDLFHTIASATPDYVVLDLNHWTIREQAIVMVLHERLASISTRFLLITTSGELGQNVPDAIDAVLVRPFTPGALLQAVINDSLEPDTPTALLA